MFVLFLLPLCLFVAGGYSAETEHSTAQDLQWYAKFGNEMGMCAGAKISERWVIAEKKCISDSKLKKGFQIPVTLGLNCEKSDDCKMTGETLSADTPEGSEIRIAEEFVFMLLPQNRLRSKIRLQSFEGIIPKTQVTTILHGEKTHLAEVKLKTCNIDGTDSVCLDIGCDAGGVYGAPVLLQDALVGISSKFCKPQNGGPQLLKITSSVITKFYAKTKNGGIGPLLKWYAVFQTIFGTCGGAKIGKRWAIADKDCITTHYNPKDIKGKTPLVLVLDCTNRDSCKMTKKGPRLDADMPEGNKMRTIETFAFMLFPEIDMHLDNITLSPFDVDAAIRGTSMATFLHDKILKMVYARVGKCKTQSKNSKARNVRICLLIGCKGHVSAPVIEYKDKGHKEDTLVGISSKSCNPADGGPQIYPITNNVIGQFEQLTCDQNTCSASILPQHPLHRYNKCHCEGGWHNFQSTFYNDAEDAKECQEACQNSDGCIAFYVDEEEMECYLVYKNPGPFDGDKPRGFWIKDFSFVAGQRECPGPQGCYRHCVWYEGFDVANSTARSAEQCQARCSRTKECNAFIYTNQDIPIKDLLPSLRRGTCYMKEKLEGDAKIGPGLVMGPKCCCSNGKGTGANGS